MTSVLNQKPAVAIVRIVDLTHDIAVRNLRGSVDVGRNLGRAGDLRQN